MLDTLTIDEVAKDLKISPRSVRRLAKNGDLPVITKPFRGGFNYTVPVVSYLEWKKGYYKAKKDKNYLADLTFLKAKQDEWLEWCEKGLLIGKPLSERTIAIYKEAMERYWKLSPRRYRRTPLITLENIRAVYSKIDVKSYTLKKHIYDALRSFLKFLSVNGYIEKEMLEIIKEIRPKRFYPPKKLHCTQEQFEKLLEVASTRCPGQSDYDVALTTATIATIGFAGLRISELCNLRFQDVDMEKRTIFVYLGKGKKNRCVGICKRLYEHLIKYLDMRPQTDIKSFFLTINQWGNPVPFDRKTISRRISRLSERSNIPVSPHALRRTMATLAANSGKPINIISLALGHADLKTTQGYLMTSEDEVVKEMQGW